jgi:hypothetical protein
MSCISNGVKIDACDQSRIALCAYSSPEGKLCISMKKDSQYDSQKLLCYNESKIEMRPE